MRIIVIFPQLVHWSALSSHLTGPLIALAYGEALLIDTFSSLLAGPSLSASPSPSLVTLSFSDIFCDFPIILDTMIWWCAQGSRLSSLSTLLAEIIQYYGFTYCLYFIRSEMFTACVLNSRLFIHSPIYHGQDQTLNSHSRIICSSKGFAISSVISAFWCSGPKLGAIFDSSFSLTPHI